MQEAQQDVPILESMAGTGEVNGILVFRRKGRGFLEDEAVGTCQIELAVRQFHTSEIGTELRDIVAHGTNDDYAELCVVGDPQEFLGNEFHVVNGFFLVQPPPPQSN